MRLPQCWNDRGLLEDEPFNSHFLSRAAIIESRTTRNDRGLNWDKDIAEAVQRVSGGVCINYHTFCVFYDDYFL